MILDTGAAIGTSQSGIGICSLGILRPEMIVKSIVPVVMAGILGIYGLIVSVILIGKSNFIPSPFFVLLSFLVSADNSYTLREGFKFLASGACCGFSGLVRSYIN